jgi:hypothetical protein
MDVKKCKSCGADIVWARMDSGAMMPVDAKKQVAVVMDEVEMTGHIVMARTSHFATCPHASDHRKPR